MKHIKLFENFTNVSLQDEYKFRTMVGKMMDHGIEPSKEEKDMIDEISEYKGLYENAKIWLRNLFNVFKKYDFEDIEDRLLEFFDQISNWDPMLMFSISTKKSSLGVSQSKLNDEKYFIYELGHVLKDILYTCKPDTSILTKKSGFDINDYFKNMRPAIHLDLNRMGARHNQEYNLLFIESLADRIVKRFKYLYDITGVDFRSSSAELDRENRKYDPNIEIYDYTIKMYLK
jgi:hypothetical protein